MRRFVLVLATLLPTTVIAGDNSVDIRKMEGAYRSTFRSGDTTGAKYNVTDTLEILGVDKGRVYFSLGLNFFNDHTCSLSGIAESEKGGLVYRDSAGEPGKACELRITFKKGRVGFEDHNMHCRDSSCGARGGYGGDRFKMTGRRKLTSKERQEALTAYKAALEELRDKPRPPKNP